MRICSALLLILGAVSTARMQSSSRFVLASVADSETRAPVPGLGADDFVVQEGTTRCETIAARPAQYPIVVVVDTSQAARPEFTQIRKAVRQFVGRMSGRDVALYTFGDRAFRVQDFTRDTSKLERAVDHLFALPDGESHVLDGIIDAATDIRSRESAVGMIVVVSAGANDQSSRAPSEVFEPVVGGRSIVQVIEMRTPRASGRLSNARGRRNFTSDRSAEAALGLEEVLRGLAERTRGEYERIYSASGYFASLEQLQRRLAAEVVVEYASPTLDGTAGALQIGTRVPGGTVRAIGLDRAPR
jgi:hypothetical protein